MKKRHVRFSALISFLFILPLLVMAVISYIHTRRDVDQQIYARRRALSELGATFIEEKLDHLVNIGVSYATRPYFIKFVEEDKWDEARGIISNALSNFSFISIFFLTDTDGNIKAGLPGQDELLGQNFAFRDWYKGVTSEWKPYVSEVYETRYKPFYKVVAITLPIKDARGTPLGILAFLVKLDVFADWIKKFNLEGSGIMYFVDSKGHLVAHPGFNPQGDIIDFTAAPVVQKVLSGQDGAEILYNPISGEKELVVYKPVSAYGWGCIVAQPKNEAFLTGRRLLRTVVFLYLAIILSYCALVIFVLRYISQQIASEEKILKLNTELNIRIKQMSELNKELEAFSYSVSHDLRAPLRSIDGFSHILLDEYKNKLDAEGKRLLERIRAASQHMADLIDDLLSLARISRSELKLEDVDLSALAAKIIKHLRDCSPDRDVEFSIAPGMVVKGDGLLLESVLLNLLENAWKFTSKHNRAKIEFGVNEEGKRKIYFVRDDGAGFDPKYSSKLFGTFQRLHAQSEFPGTGIGLATVRRVIHRHGGSVWAKGSPEKGATFYFTLGGLP